MHRIDTNGHVANLFSDGNPGIGQPATLVDAAFLNAVQENIVYPILQAGIPLVKGTHSQLYAAILSIATGAAGAGGGAVPTSRQVLGGGLATGGGALTADRTLTVTKASSAEILTGTEDGKAITPLGLATAMAAGGSAPNRYIKLPGGDIIQRGQVRGTYTEGTIPITFPISFPTAVDVVLAFPFNLSGNLNLDTFMQGYSSSLSGATIALNWTGSGTNQINGLDFIAIGK